MKLCAECKYAKKIESEPGLGLCYAPLPYWIHVEKMHIRVSIDPDEEYGRKCFAYKEKGRW